MKKKFIEGHKRIEAEKLKGAVKSKLDKMVRGNKTRMTFMEKFQRLIDEYNSGSINVEAFFQRLVEFASQLNEEEKRGITENLSEEELAIFDLLYKDELAERGRKQVRLAAKDLLDILKREKLVLDWRKRQQTRADVLLTIQKVLDQELPTCYTPDIYQEKCNLVYQHVYDSYYGAGRSVYSAAA